MDIHWPDHYCVAVYMAVDEWISNHPEMSGTGTHAQMLDIREKMMAEHKRQNP